MSTHLNLPYIWKPIPHITNQVESQEQQGEGGLGETHDADGGHIERPWEERLKRNSENTVIYALLVGINEYYKPVTSLNGCVKDVERIEAYLRKAYGDSSKKDKVSLLKGKKGETTLRVIETGNLRLCVITDLQATHKNVVRGFREHLCNATGTDSVWFHYSGHGAEQYTAKEFYRSKDKDGNDYSIEPNGRDQTLVLNKRPGSSELRYLADKEMAVLLHEVAHGRSKKGEYPHIVVTMDSCHSGSSTRNFMEDGELKTRAYKDPDEAATYEEAEERALKPKKGRAGVRTLDSYLDGYYTKAQSLEIPSAEHVLISAARTTETAGDLPRGGVFTSSLMDCLEAAHKEGRSLHYTQLFTQTRAAAHSRRAKQTPQFETIKGFDPYTCFLEGWALGNPDQYEVYQKSRKWYVRAGAIHGLPVRPEEEIKVRIIDAATGQTAGYAIANKVGAQHSLLDLASGTTLSANDNYVAELLTLPAEPVYVKVSGDKTNASALKKAWDSSKNILIAEKGQQADIEVAADKDGNFLIKDANTGRKFNEISTESGDGKMETRIGFVQEDLGKIAKWKRTIELENPNSKIREKFDFELLVTDKNGSTTPYKGKEIKLYGTEENLRKNKFLGFNFRIELKSTTQDLFFYAYDLSTSCAIKFRGDEAKFARAKQMRVGQKMDLRSAPYGWGFGDDDTEITRWFKLFVTTEELDYQQLEQKALTLSRDEEEDFFEPEAISNDWATVTMKVTMVRQTDQVGDRDARIGDGALTIKGHPSVTANVALSTASAGERSSDPTNQLARFEEMGLAMADLGEGSRDLNNPNVIELTDIQVDDPSALQEDPLQIVMPGKLGKNEIMLPIAFDGQNFRVIGDAEASSGEITVNVRELPDPAGASGEDGDLVPGPFGEEPEARSLFKALKMAFFKMALNKPNQNQLCWAEYKPDGSVERNNDKGIVDLKVANAKNILLVIHGIIGDTGEILENLPFIQNQHEQSLRDQFDLVLSYDYENLNTPIEDTAVLLKKALADAGLKAGDRKNLTILAHSMGGLVSRWFIEREGGNKVVDHLILAGTPNNGSNFGSVEGARSYITSAMDMAINFNQRLIGHTGFLFRSIRAASNLLYTLGQMNPGSDFLKKLNSSKDPGVAYTIIGGDISDYEGTEKGLGKLVEAIELKMGDWVNKGDRHDIAVKLNSIRNTRAWQGRNPKPKTRSVVCHHLNYFTSDAGRKLLGGMKLPKPAKVSS